MNGRDVRPICSSKLGRNGLALVDRSRRRLDGSIDVTCGLPVSTHPGSRAFADRSMAENLARAAHRNHRNCGNLRPIEAGRGGGPVSCFNALLPSQIKNRGPDRTGGRRVQRAGARRPTGGTNEDRSERILDPHPPRCRRDRHAGTGLDAAAQAQDKTFVMKLSTATINDTAARMAAALRSRGREGFGRAHQGRDLSGQPARPDPAPDRRRAVRLDPGLDRAA